MRIQFAFDHAEADDLIEEMIDAHPDPQRLCVVSSDRRIQKNARRRKAKYVDSREWLDELFAARVQSKRLHKATANQGDPSDSDIELKVQQAPLAEDDVSMWMRAMGFDIPSKPSEVSSSRHFSGNKTHLTSLQRSEEVAVHCYRAGADFTSRRQTFRRKRSSKEEGWSEKNEGETP